MKNRPWLHVVCALAIGLLAFAPCRGDLFAQEDPGPPRGEPRDDRFDRDPGPSAEGRLQRLMKAIQFLRDQGFPKEADMIGRELKQAPDGPRREGGDEQRREAPRDQGGRPDGPDKEHVARIRHLAVAIEHLQAAGMPDLAMEVKEKGGRMLGMGPGMPPQPGMPSPPPPGFEPQMDRLSHALEETRKALGEVERRVRESEQLGRAVDEAHQRINEMSRLAEERAREMEQRLGPRLEELERHVARRMQEMERGVNELLQQTQRQMNEQIERLLQEQQERVQMEQREREEMKLRELQEMKKRQRAERAEKEKATEKAEDGD